MQNYDNVYTPQKMKLVSLEKIQEITAFCLLGKQKKKKKVFGEETEVARQGGGVLWRYLVFWL